MKILFIGDIFGECGIVAIENELSKIIKEYKIDFVIANAENVSEGRGLYIKDYNRLIEAGINFITMGNHTWHKKEDIKNLLENKDNIIRPNNLLKGQQVSDWGVGTKIVTVKGKQLRITNLIGTSIKFAFDQSNPFTNLDEILNNDTSSDIHIVDFHAETTSEKNAFLISFSGKISAILGTHTHVQTADTKIVNNTAYITDVGLTGPSDGVIGAKPESIINKFRGESEFFRLEEQIGKYQFSAVFIEFDINTNLPITIKNILKYQ